MITSNQNGKVKLVRALLGRAKERREAGAFVVEGVRLFEEAMNSGWAIRFVLFDETLSERGNAQIEHLISRGVEVEQVSTSVMRSISETETPQGVLAVVEITRVPIPAAPNFFLVPDQVRDPGNLGTLLRSAAATGVQAVLIPPDTVDAFAPKVVRSGMGAHFRLAIQQMDWHEIHQVVQSAGAQTFVADMNGASYWQVNLRQPVVLVVGSEAEGVSKNAKALANGAISIPMTGEVESLNAGVAGSILMFEVARQRTIS